jgi:hypothetical protein
VNGSAGAVITVRGRPIAVIGFTVGDGRIVAIDAIADPERDRRVAAAVLDDRDYRSIRITTRLSVGWLTSMNPASAKTLRLPTFNSPQVMSSPGWTSIG